MRKVLISLNICVLIALFGSCAMPDAESQAKVTGRVYYLAYIEGNGWDTVKAINEKIYLVSEIDSVILDEKRTNRKGEYKFKNLVVGNYKIFVYSRRKSSPEKDSFVQQRITINQNNQVLKVEPFLIYK